MASDCSNDSKCFIAVFKDVSSDTPILGLSSSGNIASDSGDNNSLNNLLSRNFKFNERACSVANF